MLVKNRANKVSFKLTFQKAPMCTSTAASDVSLKKPHHIITMRFSEVVNDHAKYLRIFYSIGCFTDIL